MRRDFTMPTAIRPPILNDMQIVGYKYIGPLRLREVYRDGKDFYSWVYTIKPEGDVGTVHGPLKSL